MTIHSTVDAVTRRIVERSRPTRTLYLDRIARAAQSQPARRRLGYGGGGSCGPWDTVVTSPGLATTAVSAAEAEQSH